MIVTQSSHFFSFEQCKQLFFDEFAAHPNVRMREEYLINSKIQQHTRSLFRMIGDTMKKKPKSQTKFEFRGYANVNIPAAHEKPAQAYALDSKACFMALNEALLEGYSLKIYADHKEETFRASITCMNPDDDNFGFILSAFADDWTTALGILLYKHYILCQRVWDATPTGEKRPFG